jgi:hypothetical protein
MLVPVIVALDTWIGIPASKHELTATTPHIRSIFWASHDLADACRAEAGGYAAVGGPNQVVSASGSPSWVRSPAQAFYCCPKLATAWTATSTNTKSE